MSAINLCYNSDLVDEIIVDNVIILKNRFDGKIIYKFPIPKNFKIDEKIYWEGSNRPCYVMTPYKLNQPNYIPEGYTNLCFGLDGLWHVNNGKRDLAYIDTTLLSEESYEYSTLGKFKITSDEIPKPFWIPTLSSLDCCYYVNNSIYSSNISKALKQYDESVRILYEEELASVFALNDLGFKFFEHLPENIYRDCFFKYPERYYLCVNEFCLDNWDIVVASRENRNAYKMVFREKERNWNESYWYRSKEYINMDRVHIWPVFENSKVKEGRSAQLVKKI